MAVNYLPPMLEDINRFCVKGNSYLSVDTTFEICDNLYLTDTTYQNLALLEWKGKHPEFPGPSFWNFRKSRDNYRQFAADLIDAEPNLINLQKIGHELDAALAKGESDNC